MSNQGQDAVQAIGKEFDGGDAVLPQALGSRTIFNVGENTVPAPILGTALGITAVGQRIDEERPRPIGLDVLSNPTHDSTTVTAKLIDAEGHVRVAASKNSTSGGCHFGSGHYKNPVPSFKRHPDEIEVNFGRLCIDD
jgi:hypothetical protein